MIEVHNNIGKLPLPVSALNPHSVPLKLLVNPRNSGFSLATQNALFIMHSEKDLQGLSGCRRLKLLAAHRRYLPCDVISHAFHRT